MADFRSSASRTTDVGERLGHGAGVVLAQIAVALCATVLVGWGLAAFAGLETLLADAAGLGTAGRVSWALLGGLYVGLLGVAASAGALALGWLPVFALAHLAWLWIPAPRRWLTSMLYPAPVAAFFAAAWLLPNGPALLQPASLAIGLAFATIPSLVLLAFHLWVLTPANVAPANIAPANVAPVQVSLEAGNLRAALHQLR